MTSPCASRYMSRVAASGAFSRKSMKVLRPSASWMRHEAAAAEVAGRRIDDRERVADRDRRIDGVAALLQHLDADFAGEMLRGHHHAVLRRDRGGRSGRASPPVPPTAISSARAKTPAYRRRDSEDIGSWTKAASIGGGRLYRGAGRPAGRADCTPETDLHKVLPGGVGGSACIVHGRTRDAWIGSSSDVAPGRVAVASGCRGSSDDRPRRLPSFASARRLRARRRCLSPARRSVCSSPPPVSPPTPASPGTSSSTSTASSPPTTRRRASSSTACSGRSMRAATTTPGDIRRADIAHSGLQECALAVATRDPRLWRALPELLEKGARAEACPARRWWRWPRPRPAPTSPPPRPRCAGRSSASPRTTRAPSATTYSACSPARAPVRSASTGCS